MSDVGFVQDQYPVQITTPLGADTLRVESLEGDEALSQPYEFTLRLVSEDATLDFDAVVGKEVAVSIAMPDGAKRYVHGIVARFRQAGTALRQTTYFAHLRPKLWLLSLATDSRIFQNKSVPEIVKQVLSEHEVTDVSDTLTGSYPAREYCVQYQETALAFISRLMADAGIWYRFDHTADAHTLVLADDASGYVTGPSAMSVAGSDSRWTPINALPECSLEVQVTSGGYKLDDYNFETPATDLLGVASGDTPSLTVYEYPADEAKQNDVEAVATRRLEGLELERRVLNGSSNNADLRPGHTFGLGDHPRSDANTTFVVRRVTHAATQETYSNRFEALPSDVRFRPARDVPAPRIVGCQTATVVGKSGEEITTDQYGRVKVKFHWDQSDAKDETSSCWLRVAQGWAGQAWGSYFLPRVGQEVVVSFLDGNPDRPLVTGSVYNAQQLMPYSMPANQTRSGVKTDSSKGGGGFNEIRFEDKKDSEEIFIQAQKDMNVSVLHDQTVTVKNARTVTVQDSDDTLKVEKGNHTVEIKGKETYTVSGERAMTVTGAETLDNGASLTHTIKDDVEVKIGGKLALTITGDLTLNVSGKVTIHSDGSLSVDSTGDLTQKAGGKLANESGTELTIKAGTNLTSEAGVAVKTKSGATHNVEAGAILVLKGAMVKIN